MKNAPIASNISYLENSAIDDAQPNTLFASAWADYTWRDFGRVLEHSLAYICAFDGARLVGFVNVAWDGGSHAFLLDPTVQREYWRRGIGLELVRHAGATAARRGAEWLHVDYVPELERFYEKAGFRPTAAGLRKLTRTQHI